jgi:hypothetical protein
MFNIETLKAPQLHLQDTEKLEDSSRYLPMLHGKVTDSIATMAGSTIVENRLNNTGIVDTGEVKLVIEKFTELSGTLGVSTHKLLSTAIASFTQLNHTGNRAREANYTAVNIPLKEYALYCGYDVEEHATETPEEAEKEAKRVKGVMDNARSKIRKDLSLLYSSSLSWKEKVRGKQGDYLDIRLIEAKGIKSGHITIKFTQIFSEYLVQLPITQYPIALLRVDERNTNAYSIGLKMAEHFNMDNNLKRETAQLLKVKTLLAVTTLPSIDNEVVKRNGWENRIKEPFEKSLDALTACGLLKDWEYSHSKGEAMTDEEATSFNGYEEWAETLIHFTLKDAPDHTRRLEARTEELKARTKTAFKKKGV